jgi:transcriptional regulator with XRE-family HTH domain
VTAIVVADPCAVLLAVRVGRGLSRQRFADLAGVPYVYVWRWETGKNVPAVDTLRKVADVFGFDLALMPKRHPGARSTGTGWPEETR